MIREPAHDQINANEPGDDDKPSLPECTECGDPTDNTQDGEPRCQECLTHDCSDDPCDKHNPYSGQRPW